MNGNLNDVYINKLQYFEGWQGGRVLSLRSRVCRRKSRQGITDFIWSLGCWFVLCVLSTN